MKQTCAWGWPAALPLDEMQSMSSTPNANYLARKRRPECLTADARRRAKAARDAVMTNADLVCVMFNGNIGPNTLAIASQVCKTWRAACSTEAVLRAAALYTGGVTKGVFCGMFALTYAEARAIPHDERRSSIGRLYFLYSAKAVDAVLVNGGAQALSARRRRRLLCSAPPPFPRARAIAPAVPHRYAPERWRVEEVMRERVRRDSIRRIVTM